MWQAPPTRRLAEVGGAGPKPEARRGASSSPGTEALPAVVRWPRRIAKAGRRLLTTQVSSGAAGEVNDTQRPRAGIADALALADDTSARTRKKPGRHSQPLPRSAYSLSVQSTHVSGKPFASFPAPACFWKSQTHSSPIPTKCDGHIAQSLPRVVEYLPAAQSVQVLSEEAPGVVEYLPAAQWMQTEAAAAEYLPATQLLQTSPVCAGEPKYLPAAQLSHVGAPGVMEYLPAAQSVQVLSEAVEYVPAAQSLQTLDVVAPGVTEYLPAAHLMHVPGPVNGL
jgi:hypothetical protein